MNLKFTSNINQGGSKSVISFETKVTISTYNIFKVYEFIDPKTNVLNRIEVSKDEVNIFMGPSSLNLVMNTTINASYNTPQGEIYLSTFLTKLTQKKNKVEFTYNLKSNNKIIGKYSLKLETGEI